MTTTRPATVASARAACPGQSRWAAETRHGPTGPVEDGLEEHRRANLDSSGPVAGTGESFRGQTASRFQTGPRHGRSAISPSSPANRCRGLATSPWARSTAGYDPYAGFSRKDYYEKYWDSTADDGQGSWRSLPDGGFGTGIHTPNELRPGETINRFGPTEGEFASPDGTPCSDEPAPEQR